MQIEKALLVLSQAVVVLIFIRMKACADAVERVIRRTPVMQDVCVAVLVVRNALVPPGHGNQR